MNYYFNSEALRQQHEAHKAARERLWNPKNAVKPAPAKQVEHIDDATDRAKIAALRSKLLEAENQIKLKQELIDKLALDLADANARILHQAEIIEEYRAAADPLDVSDAPEAKPRKQVKQIIAEVLRDYPDVSWEDIRGVRRTRRLIEPRHRCMAAVYEQRPDLSLPAIGRIFGGRDHSTCLHAINKIKDKREREKA